WSAMTDKSVPKLDWQVVTNLASPRGARGWGRVRAAQLHEMGRAMQIAAWSQVFNALLICYFMAGRAPAPSIVAWLLGLTLLIVFVAHHKRQLRGRQIHSLPRRTLNKVAYHTVAFAMIWAFPARFFFEFANHGQQLGICAITATLMACATFVFAPIASAAIPYVLIMGIAMTRMLMTSGSVAITAIGPLYTLAMLAMVIMNGRAFLQRKWLDLALEEREETVSLLLREFESSDADWLWHTNAALSLRNVSARFARAIGRTAEELEGVAFIDLLKGVPRPDHAGRRAVATIEAAMARREPFADIVVPMPFGDELRSIELSARPTFTKKGRFTGYHGVGSDVTETRLAADRIAHMARH